MDRSGLRSEPQDAVGAHSTMESVGIEHAQAGKWLKEGSSLAVDQYTIPSRESVRESYMERKEVQRID